MLMLQGVIEIPWYISNLNCIKCMPSFSVQILVNSERTSESSTRPLQDLLLIFLFYLLLRGTCFYFSCRIVGLCGVEGISGHLKIIWNNKGHGKPATWICTHQDHLPTCTTPPRCFPLCVQDLVCHHWWLQYIACRPPPALSVWNLHSL